MFNTKGEWEAGMKRINKLSQNRRQLLGQAVCEVAQNSPKKGPTLATMLCCHKLEI
jgi:hypothetical protein